MVFCQLKATKKICLKFINSSKKHFSLVRDGQHFIKLNIFGIYVPQIVRNKPLLGKSQILVSYNSFF